MQSDFKREQQPAGCSSSTDQSCQRLIDLLLRSTSCTDADGVLLNECCQLLDQIVSPQTTLAPRFRLQEILSGNQITWPRLLQSLAGISGDDAWCERLRQTASIALRLRALESQFATCVEAAKTEAIYHLAYGLSHELNNPLAIIAARAGQLTPSISTPAARTHLENIIDSAMRGCEMLGDLMLIARPPKPRPRTIDFAELRKRIVERAERWCRLRDVRLDIEWTADGSGELDDNMLAESVWCLLRNAIEASNPGNVIQISAIVERDHLTLRIADQGPGLSDHGMKHAFDPYFSGREAGRGLGMGLAKACRLVQLVGGDVSLQNRPDGGCIASVWVPIVGM